MEATLESNLIDNKKASLTARTAVALFLFGSVPLSLYETNVHSKYFVAQDPVATVSNLIANESSFRIAILSHFLGTLFFVMMAMLFYRLLRPVDKHLARLMIIPLVAQIAIVFILEVFNFTALMTLKSEPRATFDIAQQQEAAYFLLRVSRFGIGFDKLPFGLFFIPLGMLVYKSGFVPRIIGMMMIVGGIGYLTDTTLYTLLQRPDYLKVSQIKILSSATYGLAFLWFLVMGVRRRM